MKIVPSHFMLSVKNMKKSLSFYQKKLGLKVVHSTDEWSELVFDKKISLALRKTKLKETIDFSAVGFLVNNCEKATKYFEAKGIKIKERCGKRKNVIITKFDDPDGNGIWIAETIKKTKKQKSAG